METSFDRIAKVLATNLPRRQMLRHLGGILGGVVLATLGLPSRAKAVTPAQQLLCIQLCRGAQRVQNIWRRCMLTCQACPNPQTQLCAPFGTVCCPSNTFCIHGECLAAG